MPVDKELVAAFNGEFKLNATPEIVARLLGSPHVRDWYAAYKAARNQTLALPPEWRDAGVSPEEWARSLELKKLRRDARNSAMAEISEASKAYMAAVDRANKKCSDLLRANQTPLVLAFEGNFTNLSLAAQYRIESSENPEAREAQLASELADARKEWVQRAKAGSHPFR